MAKSSSGPKLSVPKGPIHRWLVPVKSFLQIEAVSGGILLACTVIALVIANSPFAHPFAEFWETHVAFTIGHQTLSGELGHLIINDALMTIFFFVVGLEVKREIVSGELRDPRKALLPIVGALGGVLTPATIYFLLQWDQIGQRGWAIPMATDIAFVIGILALFGNRIPFGLKVFLLTLAIVDDLVAVLVIAFVFTESISYSYLALAAVGCVLTYLLNKIGVRSVMIYVAVGVAIWLAFYHAGVHSTIAGVILGLMTPSKAWISETRFKDIMTEFWERLTMDDSNEKLPENVEQLEFVAREAISPLHRLEMSLHPWVAFFIMPVFALANAGVSLESAPIANPVTIAVVLGLAVGKPLGIILFCFMAVKMGITRLPDGVTWRIFVAGGFLGGIGFTMALFLNTLAFPGSEFAELQAAGKVGTLIGSLVSAIIGCGLLVYSVRRQSSNATMDSLAEQSH
jgi:Na+:H+ antiporter, NhaA family